MEFKLNKIDPDLRQKVNDSAKEGIVHGTKNIAINKDKIKDSKEKNNESKKQEKNKKVLVDATKAEHVEIEAIKENVETDKVSKGVYLDTKK